MTAPEVLAAPFPWFGGKRRAASTIWEALGDPGGYADGDADGAISSAVRAWCLTANPQLRIALCGYDTEHADLEAHGWRVIQGSSGSGPGYSARADNGRRERIWLSPACLYGGQDTLLEAL